MTKDEFKKKIIGINPALECLKFLVDRIERVDYRGIHKMQHYRWDLDYIKIVLSCLPKDTWLYHTQGDIDMDYCYSDEEVPFCYYLRDVNKQLGGKGSVTDMVMRKIIFVNLHRMGLIDRYTKKQELCEIGKVYRNYRYVKITKNGLKLINSKNLFEDQKNLGLALDFAFDGLVQDVLEILKRLDFISLQEMMYFVSYLGYEHNGNILTQDDIVSFVEEFRSLGKRSVVIDKILAEYCIPENFYGNKKDKRDYHNWKNSAQSIFNSFGLMAYFDYNEKTQRLMLRTEIRGEKICFKRSGKIKLEYFLHHGVEKDLRFELHHIVPFYFAKSVDELKVIDDWRNLIYIDANNHKILSHDKAKNRAIRLEFDHNDVVLDNLTGDKIRIKYPCSAKYNIELQKTMIEYNQRMLSGS